ncbi:hypothetical protein SAMD00079811_39750 [Scytonema sp. HK-05]|uniref:hypothetical protein n=1 Tax=Scytonema sp. HK-05 TaxID=1137095 RepID=UPI000A48E15E|nr:hypothetical protein [Scytonema sp. HK-05]BAY46366.1 hypothetical protein SAMD00079811_39750 [Scytonema sp. HK-05]
MAVRKEMMNFRITEQEKEIVHKYCELTGRTQTDVFREFVRSLEKRLEKLGASTQ